MKVSVVIPTYNRAYIIRDALESALVQTYRNFEIIIVDDGSSDNTREIVESYRSDKIRYVRHEKNRGCSAACNTGIAEATGDLVGFLDSDDCWMPEYLERQIGFFSRHPEVSAVFTDVQIVGDRETIPSLTALMKRFSRILEREPKAEEYVLQAHDISVCSRKFRSSRPLSSPGAKSMQRRVRLTSPGLRERTGPCSCVFSGPEPSDIFIGRWPFSAGRRTQRT